MSDFADLAHKLAAGARATAHSRLPAPDIRRVLRFLSKVALVVDQALEDVLALALDIQYIRPHELTDDRRSGLQKELDLLISRSHYRDMEEICSRLGMLRAQYEQQIGPLLKGVDTREWGNLFALVDEREGYVVYLVHQSTTSLRALLLQGSPVAALNAEARSVVTRLKASLVDLRRTTNDILGLSGTPGLMELTALTPGSSDSESIVEVYDMSHSKHVNFGDSAVFSGNLTVADSIQHSFNAIQKAANPDLEKALESLARQVSSLCQQLPVEDQETVSRRLKSLVEEASAKKPDPSVLAVSAGGILEAAKAVASMIEPIRTAVTGVLSMLGTAL